MIFALLYIVGGEWSFKHFIQPLQFTATLQTPHKQTDNKQNNIRSSMEKYTIEQLDAKTIFEVRDIAKEVGVSSPTKMKKKELIDMILKITSCEIVAPEPPRRGRPPKETYNKAEEQLLNDDLTRDERAVKGDRYNGRPTFKPINRFGGGFNDADEEQTLRQGSAEQERSGFLELYPDGYGFLRVKNGEINDMDAYVPAPKIKQYG